MRALESQLADLTGGDWESDDERGGRYRYLFDAPRPIEERDSDPYSPFCNGVQAGVRQWGDGRVTDPSVNIGDSVFAPGQARDLARALVDAADTAERLSR